MHDVTHPRPPGDPALRRRFPAAHFLREHAPRRSPAFAIALADGGAGADTGVARAWASLDGIELLPRVCNLTTLPRIETELFGRRYAAPFGVTAMGGAAIICPGADTFMAEAAQRARIPYVLSTTSGLDIEECAALAPDVWWFQPYRLPLDDQRITRDLVARASAAGAHVLVMTVDTPFRSVRARAAWHGMGLPFRIDARMVANALSSPRWLYYLARYGLRSFEPLMRYAGGRSGASAGNYLANELRGAFTWEELKRYRDLWSGPMVLKGVMHPRDAEKAVAIGFDGVEISNHGGRQAEGSPAPIDLVPAAVAAVGGRATVLVDGGIRNGLDVVRACAAGASAAFMGKAFLWSLGAAGRAGPAHLVDIVMDEVASVLGQAGAASVAEAAGIAHRHPTAWTPDD